MESNSNLENKNTWKSPNIRVTTSIDFDLWNLAKENGLEWKQALEFGIAFLCAEKLDELAYPDCKLLNRNKVLRENIENNSALIEKYSRLEAEEILKKQIGENKL